MGAAASVSSPLKTLERQDASTSAALISQLNSDPGFLRLSEFEANGIVQRDAEDADKLAAGVQISIDQGVLPVIEAPQYMMIDVLGKTPDDVCDVIVGDVGDAANTGAVIVLCGLSGTGKGTTVDKLKEKLPNCVTWSNGNVFRSLTLLAATWCEQQGLKAFDADKALTTPNLAKFMQMLEFGKFGGSDSFDIKISGLGIDALVSEVKNTELKGPKVSKNIPTVARVTQGQVVKFAANATSTMGAAGLNVVLEGREATVNYVPSPYRYCLTMSDILVIGQRRAAQRLGAATLNAVAGQSFGSVAEEAAACAGATASSLVSMVTEIPREPWKVVFVLGGPGSGKGTQCARIVERFGYVHLSAGDLLRAERKSGSDKADMINSYIKEGKIVPAEVTVGLLKDAMERATAVSVGPVPGFLIDGFPRSIDNAECFDRILGPHSEVQFMLFFDCPMEVMEQRLLKRGETSGRDDDTLAVIKKRFDTFVEQSMPVVEVYRSKGLVRSLSAVPPPDVVFESVARLFDGGPVVRAAKPGASTRVKSEVEYLRDNVDPVFAPLLADLLKSRPADVKGWCIQSLQSS